MNSAPETRLSLIARLQDGLDFGAWLEFVEIYEPLVHRFVSSRGIQYADAAEITQDVLTRIANALDSWDARAGSFRAWLFTITRNMTIDHLRKLRTHRKGLPLEDVDLNLVADPTMEDSKQFQLEYERQLFFWAANKIRLAYKPKNWQAFWLSTIEALPVAEVADRLSITCATVYVARSRIMARLSEEVRRRLDELQRADEEDS